MDKKGKFEKMAEMMRNCCKDEGELADCCSMMRKMMGQMVGQMKRGEKKRQRGTVKRRIGMGGLHVFQVNPFSQRMIPFPLFRTLET